MQKTKQTIYNPNKSLRAQLRQIKPQNSFNITTTNTNTHQQTTINSVKSKTIEQQYTTQIIKVSQSNKTPSQQIKPKQGKSSDKIY